MRSTQLRLSSGTVGSRKYVPAVLSVSSVGDIGHIPPFKLDAVRGMDLESSQSAAELLAGRIVKAWAAEGHRVEAWVIKLVLSSAGGLKPSWVVRTDLVNGMPSGLGRAKWEAKFGGEF